MGILWRVSQRYHFDHVATTLSCRHHKVVIMRILNSEVECPFEASSLWALRGDFTVEKAVALKSGRVLSIEWEKHDTDAQGNATLARRVLCCFKENQIPVALRNLVRQTDLTPCVESLWWRDLYDEVHPCTTNVCAAGNRISIKTTSWVKPIDAERCTLYTRGEIVCPIFGIGNLVETLIEKDMRASQNDYASRLLAHHRELYSEPPAPVAETQEMLLMADRAPSLLQKFKTRKTRSSFRLLHWGPVHRRKTENKEEKNARFVRWRRWGCCGTVIGKVLEDDAEHEDIID